MPEHIIELSLRTKDTTSEAASIQMGALARRAETLGMKVVGSCVYDPEQDRVTPAAFLHDGPAMPE
jgi:hypothetical protein